MREARAHWEAALRQQPRSAPLHFNLAAVCEALGDRKAAEPVVGFGDEVGAAHVGPALALADLLAQHGQARGPGDDVVPLAVRGPQAHRAASLYTAFLDDAVEHRLGIMEQGAGFFADHLVIEDRGISRAGDRDFIQPVRTMHDPGALHF